jgi:hypothetical protein
MGIRHKIGLLLILLSFPIMLSAQMTYGVTGLLHMPSGEMQRDKTVMLGGNFLNKANTPPAWYYGTYNYYLNVTIFPWFEVAYTCTLFSAEGLGYKKYGYSGFMNQDRYFSFRLRALKEGQFWKYMPGVVLGTSDPFTTSSGNQIASEKGNGYFSRFYIAATKHFQIGKEEIGVHLAYLYNRRKDYHLNGPAVGVTYSPSFYRPLTFVAEYDSKDVAVGAMCLLFNHLHLQFEMQQLKWFTGGLAYKLYLK